MKAVSSAERVFEVIDQTPTVDQVATPALCTPWNVEPPVSCRVVLGIYRRSIVRSMPAARCLLSRAAWR